MSVVLCKKILIITMSILSSFVGFLVVDNGNQGHVLCSEQKHYTVAKLVVRICDETPSLEQTHSIYHVRNQYEYLMMYL